MCSFVVVVSIGCSYCLFSRLPLIVMFPPLFVSVVLRLFIYVSAFCLRVLLVVVDAFDVSCCCRAVCAVLFVSFVGTLLSALLVCVRLIRLFVVLGCVLLCSCL